MSIERMLFTAQKYLMRAYSTLLVNMDIKFESPLPEGPKILVANHPTTTDPFFLSLLSDEPVFIPVTGMAFEVPIFGKILRSAGHIPVNRIKVNGPSVIERAVEKLIDGKTIGIFPEGALSPEVGAFCQTRTGAARMALLSDAPVIPVGIHLDKDAFIRIKGSTKNYSATGRIVYRGNYAMTVGKARHYVGGVDDHRFVRDVAEEIMGCLIRQARKSEQRIKLAQSQQTWSSYSHLYRIFGV
ncbi:MAG: 1-acyl-sn-glycerol-3-phosphate acyltransferase [Anaerolineaceae bacterium]|nr:1-acyl-sn-glycerol-3-phosphate acyltransferase [Anaerolineaceae bacterium]